VTASGYSWFEVQFGLLDGLDAAGIDVVVEEGLRAHAGAGRVVADDPVAGHLLVASGTAVDEARAAGRGREVATYDPLSPTERRELDRIQREQAELLVAAGREDLVPRLENAGAVLLPEVTPAVEPAAVARITDLLERGDRASVFLLPPPGPGRPT
jgi:hypothetical protein